MILSLIVAVAENGVIGRDGGLPWRLPGDMAHFKATTMGKPIVMGRKTWESLGRALPGRHNIVVTRDAAYVAEGASVANDLDVALSLAGDVEEVMMIGGAQIYELALPRADRIYITRVHASPEGDTYFPDLDPGDWKEIVREDHGAAGDAPAYSVVTLERAR